MRQPFSGVAALASILTRTKCRLHRDKLPLAVVNIWWWITWLPVRERSTPRAFTLYCIKARKLMKLGRSRIQQLPFNSKTDPHQRGAFTSGIHSVHLTKSVDAQEAPLSLDTAYFRKGILHATRNPTEIAHTKENAEKPCGKKNTQRVFLVDFLLS